MMDKINKNNDFNLYKRSYHGSLVLLFFLFIIFVFKTSLCSQNNDDFDSYNVISVDQEKDSVEISNNYIQKNIIKELTVNKNLVNINNASVNELTELKGIGKKTAEEIVRFRNENGNFKSGDDLMKVKGIGKKKYSAIKSDIIF